MCMLQKPVKLAQLVMCREGLNAHEVAGTVWGRSSLLNVHEIEEQVKLAQLVMCREGLNAHGVAGTVRGRSSLLNVHEIARQKSETPLPSSCFEFGLGLQSLMTLHSLCHLLQLYLIETTKSVCPKTTLGFSIYHYVPVFSVWSLLGH